MSTLVNLGTVPANYPLTEGPQLCVVVVPSSDCNVGEPALSPCGS